MNAAPAAAYRHSDSDCGEARTAQSAICCIRGDAPFAVMHDDGGYVYMVACSLVAATKEQTAMPNSDCWDRGCRLGAWSLEVEPRVCQSRPCVRPATLGTSPRGRLSVLRHGSEPYSVHDVPPRRNILDFCKADNHPVRFLTPSPCSPTAA